MSQIDAIDEQCSTADDSTPLSQRSGGGSGGGDSFDPSSLDACRCAQGTVLVHFNFAAKHNSALGKELVTSLTARGGEGGERGRGTPPCTKQHSMQYSAFAPSSNFTDQTVQD